ncbi:hypothetical protein L210DRAFT_3540380 [Boletus edulis BED1]|uniref:ubiquitinyl hydrolase 1 n=1 Tax=Boletus edulis BED1 TaxID=1328754 RepID=A0AAD4BTV4_BOLED|nr:hypothetical protein L210DRAFT_3540380 [Boletus edulis BED1]
MEPNLALEYIITHVFCPLRLPGGDDHSIPNDQALMEAVIDAAHAYTHVVTDAGQSEWRPIEKMLENLGATVPSAKFDRKRVMAQLSRMQRGDVLAFYIRAQNAGVLFRKQRDVTVYAPFEVSPQASSVITTRGKLLCSYPGPAIEIPNSIFNDAVFRSQLANFLVCMNEDILKDILCSEESAIEPRISDTTDPRYITELLTGILRGVGRPATSVVRTTKRIGDDVVFSGDSPLPWRRSPLWLLIRVAIQTTLEPSQQGHDSYKNFLVFFLARLAEQAIRENLPNDLLHFMSTKISRRLRKLGPLAPGWLTEAALGTCSRVREVLDDRWELVQATQRASPPHAFSGLDLDHDMQLSLSCSREYLQKCLLNEDAAPAVPFTPEHRLRGTLDDFLSPGGAFFKAAFQAEPHVTLYDVEFAVEQGIDAWVDGVKNRGKACVKLDALADKYASAALKTYANNPEQLSIMLLTMIELWIALDKLALDEIPMLEEFDPEIPCALLEKLLLRKGNSIRRLQQAHQYLSRRHTRKDAESESSVFSGVISEETFAVRYYDQSQSLQDLKDRIEADARQEVDKKTKELKKANKQHAKIKLEADGIHHKYIAVDGTKHHSSTCRKCDLQEKLNSMVLDTYTWPLPDDDHRAAIIVFELACPLAFDMWRSSTFRLLADLCSQHPRGNRPCLLGDFGGLKPYFEQHPRSRITLASASRPMDHRVISIPATEDQICVGNSVRFFGFDTWEGIPVANAFGKVDIKRFCTYELPKGPYANLQQYVDSTLHTSNDVLAGQAVCPKDLSIHEFLAFGHLRSGGSLQWLNILRELRDRSLGFRCPEVHLLVAQAIMQVGPLSSTGLKWHKELQEETFGNALVDGLESLVADVEANWLEGVTMNTVSLLLSRLLSASPEEAVSERVIQLLRDVRTKTFSWVQELSDKLTRTPGEEELRGLLRDTAAICRSTFDVDPATVEQLLNSPEDIEIFLSCAILIHDNTPLKVSALPIYSQFLLDRDRRLSLALDGVLSDVVLADSSDRGIDLAVGRVWPDYRPGSEWEFLPEPNSRYFLCTTASTTSQCSQTVHFNLLDGTLLVDGKPLGRLPDVIVQHPLYSLLFGEQVLDVIPGDLPGMDYSTRGMISGHQVYFSLRDKVLVIRAKRTAAGRSEIIQLIPREKLENDFPAVLLKGHIHWLNLSTSVMDFCLVDKPWESSSENWSVDCTSGEYRMRKGREFLVDVRSPSWTMVSSLLKPLDAPQNLLVTASSIDPDLPSSSLRLAVALPRYGLSFYVNDDGDLQSHDIRNMVYDENQSIGTLFGLANQLVLRPKVTDNITSGELVPRCVLIPEGELSFQTNDHHVRVEVDIRGPTLQRVTYQTYRIDTELNCLTGNVSLTNKLYLACLHALTSSGYSTDPLTGKSGTEEALGLLRSASCRSTIKFGVRDVELLRLIASLCPSRSLHPHKNMQVVHWLNLPVRSQNHRLYLAAKEIKGHVTKAKLFHDGWETKGLKKFPSHDDHLFGRSLLRAHHLLPSETSEQFSRGDGDATYHSRDLILSDSAEHRAFVAATAIFQWSVDPAAITMKDLVGLAESWKSPLTSSAVLSFTYQRSWLNPHLPAIWIKAYNALRETKKAQDRFKLLFSLSSMAYRSQDQSNIVLILLAFAVHPEFRAENLPAHSEYHLSDGYRPTQSRVVQMVLACAREFYLSPESSIPARPGESSRALGNRRRKEYKARLDEEANYVADQVVEKWSPDLPAISIDSDAYDRTRLDSKIQDLSQSCSRNIQLRKHLTRVRNILCGLDPESPAAALPRYRFDSILNIRFRMAPSVTLDQLIFTRPPPPVQPRDQLAHFIAGETTSSSSGFNELQRLITTIQGNTMDPFQQQYASDLETSAQHFSDEVSHAPASQAVIEDPAGEAIELLVDYYTLCKDGFAEDVARIQDILGPSNESDQALERSGQWPRITANALFRSLASTSIVKLTGPWKKCLIRLALLLLDLQRARRLLRLALSGHREEFYKELNNGGCDGWDPEAEPDWILIQLQGNFLIRRVQVDVANEMISPRSGDNTAMQLNMGEGKSSVIVPISVAKLADGKQLVRVVVPKALTAQMFQVLVDRLSGLTNRQIYYLPFSRALSLGADEAAALQSLMLECVRKRGVMVVQPDHVLSLKLVTVEKQLFSDKAVAPPLLKLQSWLHSHARDILDESDEILHVRYQLVYTIGSQQPMEGFPERWTTTQQVLAAVRKHATSLRTSFKEGVEYESGPSGSFPHIRILQPDAAKALISHIAHDAVDGLLPNFNLRQLNSQLRDAILSFLTEKDVSLPTSEAVEEYAQRSTLWGGLLLLRGLLATDILLFAFRDQRWRVDYGLAPKRTMLAVPYRAKDVPAPKAEFGHPDVAIVLTCLSYYYGGLTEEQLKITFQLLLKQDDPSVDYNLWVRDCDSVPGSLRNYTAINLKSSEQWTTLLVPLFSRNHATIDFYLARVVFPKEAKEFPLKLACSGWDLAEKKVRLVTGFSGTNDGRYLLPLHITQRDPNHQRGTNAKVLSYLLQPENNHYLCITHENGERRTTVEFLEILVGQQPEIRVLLDVGAQMLDLQNHKLAEAWLTISTNTSAAIYFNEDDELTVLMRDGSTQLLLSSPFAQQLDQCIIYLDDAHTRGTDIKFPIGFRAAVTLGPKVTKDRLAQGCMRMRKLGHGHSLMFFAPLEIDRRIRSVAGKGSLDIINTMDILHWTIRETCDDIRQRAPHWAQQGMNHRTRYSAWSSFCANELTAEHLSAQWLQPEVKSLVELYAPHDASRTVAFTVPEIRERCISLGITSFHEGGMDEEQEREVIHEVEREREVERPPLVSPAKHSLPKEVVNFVKTVMNDSQVWSRWVLATNDFCQTIVLSKGDMSSKTDEFLRPVQWIISSQTAVRQILVILSPHEVERLLPSIRKSEHVHLHLYTPRTTKSMKPSDNFDLYNIPTVSSDWTPPQALVSQLNIFAGQLYLSDHAAYIRLCRFLCVYAPYLQDEEEMVFECDGFITPEHRRGSLAGQVQRTFQSTPLPFIKVLLGLRRKGMSFGQTHMGKILDGRLLTESDFESATTLLETMDEE